MEIHRSSKLHMQPLTVRGNDYEVKNLALKIRNATYDLTSIEKRDHFFY